MTLVKPDGTEIKPALMSQLELINQIKQNAIYIRLMHYIIHHYMPEDGSVVRISLDEIDSYFDVNIEVNPEDKNLEVKRILKDMNMNQTNEVPTTEQVDTPTEVVKEKKEKNENDTGAPAPVM